MTRLVVISSEKDLKSEAHLANELFHAGLELFHLRKPHWSADQQRSFLKEIDSRYRNRISLHQHHDQIKEFDLRYAHYNEHNRRQQLHVPSTYCSTSFHKVEDLQRDAGKYNYCFLSPVFNSISKDGYEGKFNTISPSLLSGANVFALGGIDAKNIKSVFDMGFSGAAVLGAIWEHGDPLQNFLMIQEACQPHAHIH